MSAPENPPAFPCPGFDGMSLRDWFAGQALVGLVFNAPGASIPSNMSGEEAFAGQAYAFADAMLTERKRGQ